MQSSGYARWFTIATILYIFLELGIVYYKIQLCSNSTQMLYQIDVAFKTVWIQNNHHPVTLYNSGLGANAFPCHICI